MGSTASFLRKMRSDRSTMWLMRVCFGKPFTEDVCMRQLRTGSQICLASLIICTTFEIPAIRIPSLDLRITTWSQWRISNSARGTKFNRLAWTSGTLNSVSTTRLRLQEIIRRTTFSSTRTRHWLRSMACPSTQPSQSTDRSTEAISLVRISSELSAHHLPPLNLSSVYRSSMWVSSLACTTQWKIS